MEKKVRKERILGCQIKESLGSAIHQWEEEVSKEYAKDGIIIHHLIIMLAKGQRRNRQFSIYKDQ